MIGRLISTVSENQTFGIGTTESMTLSTIAAMQNSASENNSCRMASVVVAFPGLVAVRRCGLLRFIDVFFFFARQPLNHIIFRSSECHRMNDEHTHTPSGVRFRSASFRSAILTGAVVAALAGLATPSPAHDSITNANTISWERGHVNAYSGGTSSQGWVRKYFGNAGQCLRFEVLTPTPSTDLEMVVIAPNPSTRYRNDDGGNASCPLCPLVKIDPAPQTGWYTVIVQHFSGSPVNSNFILDYRRLSHLDAACSSPSAPQQQISTKTKAAKVAPMAPDDE